MLNVNSYYARAWNGGGSILRFPKWARMALLVAALPGLALVLLSIIAFIVSLLALLLLTAPVYWLVSKVVSQPLIGGVRRVEATIVE